MRNPRSASDEAQGSYCLRAKGLRTEVPFRPSNEALYPYRAGNRCALNSLDTDRSTTRSPETVTANEYLQAPIEISQRVQHRLKIFQPVGVPDPESATTTCPSRTGRRSPGSWSIRTVSSRPLRR